MTMGHFFTESLTTGHFRTNLTVPKKSLRPKDFALQVLDVGSLTNGQLMVTFNKKMTHGHFKIPDAPSSNSKFELILTVRC